MKLRFFKGKLVITFHFCIAFPSICATLYEINIQHLEWSAKAMFDLFNNNGGATNDCEFRWSVAIFKNTGATEAIKRANDVPLKTYYPIRINKLGNLVPLWRNYLFIQYEQITTINICRSTSYFITMLSAHDNEGNLQPLLVRKDAIYENMRLFQLGRFNDPKFRRRFYFKDSLVQIIDGDFAGRKVQLLVDVLPEWPDDKKIPVNIENWRATIEIHKLAL